MKRIWRTFALIILLAFISLYSDFNPCQSWEFPFTDSNESFWDRIGVQFQFNPDVCNIAYSLAFPEDHTILLANLSK